MLLLNNFIEKNLRKLIYETFEGLIYISESIIGKPLAAVASTVPS